MSRFLRLSAGLALIAFAFPVRADNEKIGSGHVFALSKKAGVVRIHKEPSESAPGATAPNGARLVFRKTLVGADGKVTWYFVSPAGLPAGWVQASETTPNRPGDTPPPKMIPVVDSGITAAAPSSAQTAAARGLSDSAKKYASEKQDFEKTVNQFLTLEKTVEVYFNDPHDESDGSYPDVTVEERKRKAAAFKAALK